MRSYHRYFQQEAKGLVEYLRQSLDLLVQDSPWGQPAGFLAGHRAEVQGLELRLEQAFRRRIAEEQKRLAVLSGALDALSPLKVLSLGYAVVQGQDLSLIHI